MVLDLKAEPFNEDIQAEKVGIDGLHTVLAQVSVFFDGTGHNRVAQLAHERVEFLVEMLAKLCVDERFKPIPVSDDICGMENDVISTKEPQLEFSDPVAKFSRGVFSINNYATQDK